MQKLLKIGGLFLRPKTIRAKAYVDAYEKLRVHLKNLERLP